MRLEIQHAALVKLEELYRRDRSDFEFQFRVYGVLLTAVLVASAWLGYGRIDKIWSDMRERFEDQKIVIDAQIYTTEKAAAEEITSKTNTALEEFRLQTNTTLEEFRLQTEKTRNEMQGTLKQIEDSKNAVLGLMKLNDLKDAAKKLDEGDGFTKDQSDKAMALVHQLSSEISAGELVDPSDILSPIMSALYGAGRWGDLQEIEDLFPALVKSDASLRNLMIQVSMYRVFRHDAKPDAMGNAEEYLSAAWDAKYGETALPDEMLYLYKEEQDLDVRQPKGAELLRLANDFTDKEKLQFLNATGAHMNAQDLAGTPKAIHFAIEKVGKQVFEDHWRGLLTLVRDNFPELLESHAGQPGGLGTLLAALRAKLEEHPDA